MAKNYLRPIQHVIPAYPFTQVLAAFLRNDGAPGLATFATLFGGIFNVFGDIFFVFGLNMGMFGAGLATAMGATISTVIMAAHFFTKKNSIRLSRIYGHIHKAKILSMNGFSSFVSDIAMGVIAMLFNRQVMHYFNADALAVFGVIVQVSGVVQCSTYGVGQASQPIISANYGAGKWKRIGSTKKYALWTVAIFGLLWTVAVLLFPNDFVKLFMTPTAHVLQIAPGIMRIYAFSYLCLPFNIFATYYFPSVMLPKTALVISLARGILLCGILVILLPALFGPEFLWWVMPITELTVAAYCSIFIFRSSNLEPGQTHRGLS